MKFAGCLLAWYLSLRSKRAYRENFSEKGAFYADCKTGAVVLGLKVNGEMFTRARMRKQGTLRLPLIAVLDTHCITTGQHALSLIQSHKGSGGERERVRERERRGVRERVRWCE